jgi:hypothetical protein
MLCLLGIAFYIAELIFVVCAKRFEPRFVQPYMFCYVSWQRQGSKRYTAAGEIFLRQVIAVANTSKIKLFWLLLELSKVTRLKFFRP